MLCNRGSIHTVIHFSASHPWILMQFLTFVCVDTNVNYAYYQLKNLNGLQNISSWISDFVRVEKIFKSPPPPTHTYTIAGRHKLLENTRICVALLLTGEQTLTDALPLTSISFLHNGVRGNEDTLSCMKIDIKHPYTCINDRIHSDYKLQTCDSTRSYRYEFLHWRLTNLFFRITTASS